MNNALQETIFINAFKYVYVINILLLMFYWIGFALNISLDFLSVLKSPETYHNSYLGFYRPQLFFPEPAYLGLFFAAGFVVFNKLKYLYFIAPAVLLTGSLAGILVLVTLVARKTSFRKQIFYIVLAVLVFSIFNFEFLDRVFKIIDVIASGSTNSSEGSRVNSINLLFDYFDNVHPFYFLFGYPWHMTSEIIMAISPDAGAYSSFARGHQDNLIVSLVLKFGLIGSTLLLISIYKVFNKALAVKTFLLVILAVSFLSGNITYDFLWFLILLFLRSEIKPTIHLKDSSSMRLPYDL